MVCVVCGAGYALCATPWPPGANRSALQTGGTALRAGTTIECLLAHYGVTMTRARSRSADPHRSASAGALGHSAVSDQCAPVGRRYVGAGAPVGRTAGAPQAQPQPHKYLKAPRIHSTSSVGSRLCVCMYQVYWKSAFSLWCLWWQVCNPSALALNLNGRRAIVKKPFYS